MNERGIGYIIDFCGNKEIHYDTKTINSLILSGLCGFLLSRLSKINLDTPKRGFGLTVLTRACQNRPRKFQDGFKQYSIFSFQPVIFNPVLTVMKHINAGVSSQFSHII